MTVEQIVLQSTRAIERTDRLMEELARVLIGYPTVKVRTPGRPALPRTTSNRNPRPGSA